MSLTISSVSPLALPPGATVTVTGTGFTTGSRICCPAAAATTFVSGTELTAEIPSDISLSAATAIGVFVLGEDGSVSNLATVTVTPAPVKLQTYTTMGAVIGEVPGFQRGGLITDARIQGWMSSIAAGIKGAMLRRGLPLDPAQWQAAGADGSPDALGVLEMINRLGAAARLAAAVVSVFSNQDAAFSKNLNAAYKDEMTRLEEGAYDKLFRPSAATVESGPAFAGGDLTGADGSDSTLFPKEKVY